MALSIIIRRRLEIIGENSLQSPAAFEAMIHHIAVDEAAWSR